MTVKHLGCSDTLKNEEKWKKGPMLTQRFYIWPRITQTLIRDPETPETHLSGTCAVTDSGKDLGGGGGGGGAHGNPPSIMHQILTYLNVIF